MDDLIRRQSAIDAFTCDGSFFVYGADVCKAIVSRLKQLPSVQPEQKTGKWIRHDEIKNIYCGVYIECSECGEKFVVQYMEDEKFCRNCGAKMEDNT